jgi:hypothetical protein
MMMVQVFGPTMPSTTSPDDAWNLRTAASVFGPKSPSIDVGGW